MIKEPINPNNRAASFPKSPNGIAYAGPVGGFALDANIVVYPPKKLTQHATGSTWNAEDYGRKGRRRASSKLIAAPFEARPTISTAMYSAACLRALPSVAASRS
jgi:hypothetical protein